MKKKRGITIRFGPLGLSLLAAGITAVGVAAVSVADSAKDSGGDASNGTGARTFEMHAPPGGGPGMFFHDNLSEADKQKLEDFRQCMEDNGASAPPEPGEIDPSDGPPKPPSAADREKLEKAFEACKSNLPEDMQTAGPPQLHFRGCAPGDAAPGTEEKGRNQNQSNDSGTSSSGSAA
jgi:hypothetical protein